MRTVELWGGPHDGNTATVMTHITQIAIPPLQPAEMDLPGGSRQGLYRYEGTVRADGTYVLVWQGWQ